MKRLFSVFALCATALIAASTVSSPAAADGRHDGRRHASQPNHQRSWNSANRGEHRRAFRDNREHRRVFRDNREHQHHKFRRHNKHHRHGHAYGHGYRQGYRQGYGYGHGYRQGYGYGYGPPRHRRGFWPGPAYAFQHDGARIILRFD